MYYEWTVRQSQSISFCQHYKKNIKQINNQNSALLIFFSILTSGNIKSMYFFQWYMQSFSRELFNKFMDTANLLSHTNCQGDTLRYFDSKFCSTIISCHIIFDKLSQWHSILSYKYILFYCHFTIFHFWQIVTLLSNDFFNWFTLINHVLVHHVRFLHHFYGILLTLMVFLVSKKHFPCNHKIKTSFFLCHYTSIIIPYWCKER